MRSASTGNSNSRSRSMMSTTQAVLPIPALPVIAHWHASLAQLELVDDIPGSASEIAHDRESAYAERLGGIDRLPHE